MEADRRRGALPALAVAAVLLLVGVFTLARAVDETPADDPQLAEPGPSPTPTETPTPTERPSPTAAPATPPATPVPGLDELVAQLAAIRGLQPDRALVSGAVSEAELADIFSDIAFEEIDPVEIEADQRLLVALRLVPADIDLLQVVEDLYREQIVGLYVPRDEILYVRVRGGDLSPFERYTAAHEIVHALQDQIFGLEDLRDLPDEESDMALAVLALVEGDAVLTQQLWLATHQTESEREQVRSEALATGGEALARTPRYIREALVFPYREGAAFVQALHERGGFAAVDDAFADPPTTTAQIYHPDRYFQGRGPVPVTLPATPGPDWEGPRTYTFGEFDLRELLAPLGSQTATDVGTGWAGGEVRAWQRGASTAVAVAFAFDTAADADNACAAVPRWFSEVAQGSAAGDQRMQSADDWMAWSCTGLEVRFGLGPDEQTARSLASSG